jgi:type IV pilus assembly protein PilM
MSSILTKPLKLPRPGRPQLRRRSAEEKKPSRPSLGGPTLSMPRFSRSKGPQGSVVGLEIEAGSVAAAEAVVNGIPRIVAAGVQPLSPAAFRDGEVAEPAAITAALKELFDRHDLGRRVRLGIANQRLVVRTVRLPAIENPAELEAAVLFSAQEQIAMPLDEAMIEHRVVGGVAATAEAPPQIDVMVVAARRDMILASLAPLRDAGLEPVGVDLSAFGMIRALADTAAPAPVYDAEGRLSGNRSAVLYCNVGDATNLAVAAERSCLFTRVSPAGLGDVTENLVSSTGMDPEHASMWLYHVGLGSPVETIEGDPVVIARTREGLERSAMSLVDELRLSLDFYAAQEAAVPVERIVLCGPGSAIPGLVAQMEPAVGLPIAIGRPAPLSDYDDAAAARLTVPFGLALEL